MKLLPVSVTCGGSCSRDSKEGKSWWWQLSTCSLNNHHWRTHQEEEQGWHFQEGPGRSVARSLKHIFGLRELEQSCILYPSFLSVKRSEWKRSPCWHIFPGCLFSLTWVFPGTTGPFLFLANIHRHLRELSHEASSTIGGFTGHHGGCSASCCCLKGKPERVFSKLLCKERVTQHYNDPNECFPSPSSGKKHPHKHVMPGYNVKIYSSNSFFCAPYFLQCSLAVMDW